MRLKACLQIRTVQVSLAASGGPSWGEAASALRLEQAVLLHQIHQRRSQPV